MFKIAYSLITRLGPSRKTPQSIMCRQENKVWWWHRIARSFEAHFRMPIVKQFVFSKSIMLQIRQNTEVVKPTVKVSVPEMAYNNTGEGKHQAWITKCNQAFILHVWTFIWSFTCCSCSTRAKWWSSQISPSLQSFVAGSCASQESEAYVIYAHVPFPLGCQHRLLFDFKPWLYEALSDTPLGFVHSVSIVTVRRQFEISAQGTTWLYEGRLDEHRDLYRVLV